MQVLCLNRFFKRAEKLVLFELAFMAWIEEMIKKQYLRKGEYYAEKNRHNHHVIHVFRVCYGGRGSSAW